MRLVRGKSGNFTERLQPQDILSSHPNLFDILSWQHELELSANILARRQKSRAPGLRSDEFDAWTTCIYMHNAHSSIWSKVSTIMLDNLYDNAFTSNGSLSGCVKSAWRHGETNPNVASNARPLWKAEYERVLPSREYSCGPPRIHKNVCCVRKCCLSGNGSQARCWYENPSMLVRPLIQES